MERHARIYIAGHRGMVGSAILRRLQAEGFDQLLTRRHAELDLTDQAAVHRFFQNHPIDHVVLAAARVGGIQANNNYPAEFIYQNLMIEANVIHAAYRAGVRRLLFLGSSCIFPKHAAQPLVEEDLLGGWLEPTNEPYAVAKIAGIKICESYNRQYGTCFRSVMPTNLYGPNDNFDLETSHVLPAMIRKFHLARLARDGRRREIEKDETRYGRIPGDIRDALDLQAPSPNPRVVLWGTGSPFREFLHVDDLADACRFVMGLEDTVYQEHTTPRCSHLNVGTGEDLTIRELAERVAAVVGCGGEIVWDNAKPDGTPRKRLDIGLIQRLGWEPRIPIEEGIRMTYRQYLAGPETSDT
ncbi:MAG: GDP-L-fucose synthase [Desulfobacterales bacterium]|nr:GDP-L-fucose synthase [Desulfobacterales bacterium]